MTELAPRLAEPPAKSATTIEIAQDESLPIAVSRITVGLLDRAREDLRQADAVDFDKRIHSARKKMKRLRGMLRLVRYEIGYTAYRNENVVLRNTSRTISAMRDAKVLQDTLDGLRSEYAGLLDERTFIQTDAFLQARYVDARNRLTNQVVADAIVSIGAARNRCASFPIAEVVRDDFAAIAPGIERVYKRGWRAQPVALESRDVHHLHEWRKRVKYLRYQMEALAGVQPNLIGGHAGLLDELGELLGEDHDLAVLSDVVRTHEGAAADQRERWLLVALVHQQRARLLADAERLGAAAYVERPKVFVERLGAYWHAWAR